VRGYGKSMKPKIIVLSVVSVVLIGVGIAFSIEPLLIVGVVFLLVSNLFYVFSTKS